MTKSALTTILATAMTTITTFVVGGCGSADDEKTGSSTAAFEQTSLQLIRGFNGGVHTVQSTYSSAPSGRYEEARYQVNVEGPYVLYACVVHNHVMASRDPNCEGQRRIGTLGGLATSGIPLFRCNVNNGRDHIITTDPGCEGQPSDGLLGYVNAVLPGVNAPGSSSSGGPTTGEGDGSGSSSGGGGSGGDGDGAGVGGSL